MAHKLEIGTAETLRKWVRQAQVAAGERPGVSTDESAELKRLRRENVELRRPGEILKSAFFAFMLHAPRLVVAGQVEQRAGVVEFGHRVVAAAGSVALSVA